MHSNVRFKGQHHMLCRQRGSISQMPRGHDAKDSPKSRPKIGNARENTIEPLSFAKMLDISALTSTTVEARTLVQQLVPALVLITVGVGRAIGVSGSCFQ